MKKWLVLMLVLAIPATIMALTISPAGARVPCEVSYQGYLTDSAGTPIDAPVSMVFRIYDSGTAVTPVWQETHSNVEVNDGLFTTILGSGSPMEAINFNQTLWLGVEVNGDGEMTPRQQFTSASSAIHADSANALDAPDGSPTDAVYVDDSGLVGIGTTGPDTTLDIDGDLTVSGTIVEPNAVAFSAGNTQEIYDCPVVPDAGTKVAFNLEIFDIGNNYDAAEARFTAPTNGIYHFSMNARADFGGPDTIYTFYLVKNRLFYDPWSGEYLACLASDVSAFDGAGRVAGGSVDVRLDAGDYVEVYFVWDCTSGYWCQISNYPIFSYFCGHRVAALP
ncbi:MAG: hypothetical protein R6U37_06225 [Dehalococcoidia bacterium]